jgi:hypothetical protein
MGLAPAAQPKWGFRAIEDENIFDFSEAEPACEEALASFRDAGASERALEFAQDFTLLSAAEYALVPSLADPDQTDVSIPLDRPIVVAREAALAALATADCGWTDLHGLKSPGQPLRPWDAMLFAGDMSKAELTRAEWTPAPEDVEALVEQIEALYRSGAAPQARAIGEKGLVRIQGLIWKAKLAVQSDSGAVHDYIRAYLSSYPLTAP